MVCLGFAWCIYGFAQVLHDVFVVCLGLAWCVYDLLRSCVMCLWFVQVLYGVFMICLGFAWRVYGLFLVLHDVFMAC